MLTFEERVLGGNPLQWSGSGLEPDPELTQEFGPVANTIHAARVCYNVRVGQIGVHAFNVTEMREGEIYNINSEGISPCRPGCVSEL